MTEPLDTGGAPEDAPRRPLFVVEPGRIGMRQYLRDLVHHRDLIEVLAIREIKLRYRQTALGVTWVVLQPLLAAGLLGFVFGKIARLPSDGVPYFIFAFAGLLAWNSFNTSVMKTTTSLVSNASLVSKVYFPRLVLPLSTIVSVVLDFFVGLVVLVVMLVTNDLVPDARFLLVPVWLLLFILIAQGIGSVLAAISVRYRDVAQVAPVLLQLVFYASPVAYSTSAVPERYLTLYYLNPVAGLMEAFRWSVVGTPFPPAARIAYAAGVAVVVFAAGVLALEKMERKFADVI
jgi:lipopolysaccharide transport system permease protein